MTSDQQPRVWNHDEVVEHGLAALEAGGTPQSPLIDGRILSVQATPADGTATKMAVGLAVLPPGYATAPHDHEAEELATILSGEGTITIDGEVIAVRPGTVVLAPSMSTHVTTAADDEPLVVWWSYAPAGSEGRWLQARDDAGE